LAAAIKPIYTGPSAEAALAELEAFAQGPWGQKFPTVAAAWRRSWDRIIPFFAFPAPIRRVIYAPEEVPLGDTTNAIKSINARLRKIIKTRGHFPNDDAAAKLIWLALRNITADWGRVAKDWKEAINQFAILYAERFEAARGLNDHRLSHRAACLRSKWAFGSRHRGNVYSRLTHRRKR
jgi:putative transposase